MTHRENLFSLHLSSSGGIHLYLEERDANLDLAVEIGNEVSGGLIDELCGASEFRNLKTNEGADSLDRIRGQIPDFVSHIAIMSYDEALNLAEDLIMMAKTQQALLKLSTPIQSKLQLVE